MADRVVLADGTTLDMLDPESVRAYVRQALARTVEPTSAQLTRLQMLEEHAAKLEAAKPTAAPVRLVDARAAAEVLRARLKGGETP